MVISKEQFISYEKIRKSGVTNMFDVNTVCAISGLNRTECFEIMKTYNELENKYGGEKQ